MKNSKIILTKYASDYFPFNMEYELDSLYKDKLYDLINSCESIEVSFTKPCLIGKMKYNLNTIKNLRQITKKSLIDCKKALEESDTFDEAIEYLNKIGQQAIQIWQ